MGVPELGSYVPAGQTEQAEAAAAEYLPASHKEQPALPEAAWKWPALQLAQADAIGSANAPAWQAAQAAAMEVSA